MMDTPNPAPKFETPPASLDPKKSWFGMHKVLGIVFLLAAAGAAVAGVYYWQTVRNLPTSYQPIVHKDPTASWRTYTNEQYGFEFKYPNTNLFKLETTGLPNQRLTWLQELDPTTGDVTNYEGTGAFLIDIKNNTALDAYMEIKNECEALHKSSPVHPVFAYRSVIFGGKGSYQVDCDSEFGSPYTVTIVSLNEKQSMAIESAYQGKLYDQILSTFKFTQIVVSTECSGKTGTDIGGTAYPVAEKYSILGGLGAYFTAEDCSASRLAEVVKNQYPHPDHIVLSRLPSTTLIAALKQIGLMPSPEKCADKSESSCMDWRPLKESDFIPANLVRLRSFIDFINYTDCYFCG